MKYFFSELRWILLLSFFLGEIGSLICAPALMWGQRFIPFALVCYSLFFCVVWWQWIISFDFLREEHPTRQQQVGQAILVLLTAILGQGMLLFVNSKPWHERISDCYANQFHLGNCLALWFGSGAMAVVEFVLFFMVIQAFKILVQEHASSRE